MTRQKLSFIHTHIILFQILLYRLLQNIYYCSLCYSVGPWLSFHFAGGFLWCVAFYFCMFPLPEKTTCRKIMLIPMSCLIAYWNAAIIKKAGNNKCYRENVEKRDHSYIIGENVNKENTMEIPQKIKNRTTTTQLLHFWEFIQRIQKHRFVKMYALLCSLQCYLHSYGMETT